MKQSIKNALLWPILTIILISSTGCSTIGGWFSKEVKPIPVVSKPVEKPPLALIDPEPLNATNKRIEWVVITPDNATQTFEKMESSSRVLFGLTADGYQDISMLMAEIRMFITTQRQMIKKYRDYYEKSSEKDKESK